MEQLKALSLVETMGLTGFRFKAPDGGQQFSFCGVKGTKIMTVSRAKFLAKSKKLGKGSELGWVNAVKTLPCGYSFIESCMPRNARGAKTLKQGRSMTRSLIFQI